MSMCNDLHNFKLKLKIRVSCHQVKIMIWMSWFWTFRWTMSNSEPIIMWLTYVTYTNFCVKLVLMSDFGNLYFVKNCICCHVIFYCHKTAVVVPFSRIVMLASLAFSQLTLGQQICSVFMEVLVCVMMWSYRVEYVLCVSVLYPGFTWEPFNLD